MAGRGESPLLRCLPASLKRCAPRTTSEDRASEIVRKALSLAARDHIAINPARRRTLDIGGKDPQRREISIMPNRLDSADWRIVTYFPKGSIKIDRLMSFA